VLPIWVGPGSQFVVAQAAVGQNKLSMIVPEVPTGTQPWEITPADVRAVRPERVPGGTRITLGEFDLTAAIYFTTVNDPTGRLAHLQDQARRMRKLAAQWSHDWRRWNWTRSRASTRSWSRPATSRPMATS